MEIDNYFEKGPVIILPGMKEEMRLPNGVLFRYAGEVDSFVDHIIDTEVIVQEIISGNRNKIEKLMRLIARGPRREFLAQKLLEHEPMLEAMAGNCIPYKLANATAYVIAKKRGLPKSKSLFADGHESGEFLQLIRKRDVMQRALDHDGIELDSRMFLGEDFADIGGMVALRRALKRGEDGIELPIFKHREAVKDVLAKPFGF